MVNILNLFTFFHESFSVIIVGSNRIDARSFLSRHIAQSIAIFVSLPHSCPWTSSYCWVFNVSVSNEVSGGLSILMFLIFINLWVQTLVIWSFEIILVFLKIWINWYFTAIRLVILFFWFWSVPTLWLPFVLIKIWIFIFLIFIFVFHHGIIILNEIINFWIIFEVFAAIIFIA